MPILVGQGTEEGPEVLNRKMNTSYFRNRKCLMLINFKKMENSVLAWFNCSESKLLSWQLQMTNLSKNFVRAGMEREKRQDGELVLRLCKSRHVDGDLPLSSVC